MTIELFEGPVYTGNAYDIDELVKEHYGFNPNIETALEKGGDDETIDWDLTGIVHDYEEPEIAEMIEQQMANYNAILLGQQLVKDGHLQPGKYILDAGQ